MGDHFIGPYLLPLHLAGRNYLLFLQQVLLELLEDGQISASTQHTMWFQHNGAPTQCSRNIRSYLDLTFGQQQIGRGGSLCCCVRLLDLSCLDFYFWGHMKTLFYDTPADSAEELLRRIAVAAREIRDMPGVCQNVQIFMGRTCEMCIVASGRNFEHLL